VETDLSDMADELSFQLGLNLNNKSMCSISLLIKAFSFLKIYYFRERAPEWEGQRERERENLKQTPC